VSPNSPTPARLTALATTRLPVVILIGLLLLYSLLGLFARDPWKTDDVVGLATMLSAAQEGGWAWLFPHIGSMTMAQSGPLPTWVGGAFVALSTGWMNPIVAARFATLLWLAITFFALWYATYLAARRPEAQPLALPFGGEPKEAQYGRLLADISVLMLIATVGILLRTHETSEAPTLIACQAMALLGAIRLADKPRQGSILISLAVAGSFLTGGSAAGIALLIGSLLVIVPPGVMSRHRSWLLMGLGLAVVLVYVWWVAVRSVNPDWAIDWWFWHQPPYRFGSLENHLNAFRDLPWFLWPTWPLALLGIWNWRRHLLAPHVWIPTAFLIAQLINVVLIPNPGEMQYMAIAVPCAMLAALSIPTLRRAVSNALDWFALMCFSVSGVCVWLGWITQQTGWPTKLANNIARQTVGYEAQISWGAFAMALVISAAWVIMMAWRLRLHPKAAWRGALLCAAGLTSTWILLVLLWMPTVDYVRSYRPMSHQIKLALTQAEQDATDTLCIQSAGLSIGPQASLYVFDRIEVSRNPACPLLLQQTTAERLRQGIAGYERNTRTLWTGSRGADRFDRYRLLLSTSP